MLKFSTHHLPALIKISPKTEFFFPFSYIFLHLLCTSRRQHCFFFPPKCSLRLVFPFPKGGGGRGRPRQHWLLLKLCCAIGHDPENTACEMNSGWNGLEIAWDVPFWAWNIFSSRDEEPFKCNAFIVCFSMQISLKSNHFWIIINYICTELECSFACPFYKFVLHPLPL